jgi:RimJ/RimL family protein N-acetyltransferase
MMHTAALVLADGAQLGLRPIEASDRDALATWFGRLSPESRRRRFHGPKPKLTARELTYLTEVDHVTHTALVAIDETDGRLIGEARYATAEPDGVIADVAVTVADEWQGRGVGTRLVAQLIRAARANGMSGLTALTLWENDAAIALLRSVGFRRTGSDGAALEFELALR